MWIRSGVVHHNKRRPWEIGAAEVQGPLAHLATVKQGSPYAAPQNTGHAADTLFPEFRFTPLGLHVATTVEKSGTFRCDFERR